MSFNINEIREKYEKFDYIFEKEYKGKMIQYGIINGSNKILLIKPGQDGSLIGYNDKYYNLAKYVNEKYGYSVICTNNTNDGINDPLTDAMEVTESYCKHKGFSNYEIYYYGNSNGGVIAANYGYKYPNIKRMILVNPPLFINFKKIEKGLISFKGEKVVFIYGEFDPSVKFTGLLDLLNIDKLSYYIIKGEDHNLSNNTVSLESLVSKYLI